MMASKLELVGADIEALRVLYWGFDEYSSAIVAIYVRTTRAIKVRNESTLQKGGFEQLKWG